MQKQIAFKTKERPDCGSFSKINKQNIFSYLIKFPSAFVSDTKLL